MPGAPSPEFVECRAPSARQDVDEDGQGHRCPASSPLSAIASVVQHGERRPCSVKLRSFVRKELYCSGLLQQCWQRDRAAWQVACPSMRAGRWRRSVSCLTRPRGSHTVGLCVRGICARSAGRERIEEGNRGGRREGWGEVGGERGGRAHRSASCDEAAERSLAWSSRRRAGRR